MEGDRLPDRLTTSVVQAAMLAMGFTQTNKTPKSIDGLQGSESFLSTHGELETNWSCEKLKLASGSAATLQPASLFARLLVVSVLLQFAEQSTLLKLHVEALQSRVDAFIRLYGYVNQTVWIPPKQRLWQILAVFHQGLTLHHLLACNSLS